MGRGGGGEVKESFKKGSLFEKESFVKVLQLLQTVLFCFVIIPGL